MSFEFIQFWLALHFTMSEVRKCRIKVLKSLLVILVIIALIIGFIHYFKSNGAQFHEYLPTEIVDSLNSTIAGLFSTHPKDVRTKISQADIDDLLQSVETYKDNLPVNIVDTINGLVAEHKSG